MIDKDTACRLIRENCDIEVRNSPENVNAVRALMKKYGFIKLSRTVDRGGIQTDYIHSRDKGKEDPESYFTIQWAYYMSGKYCFSPLREISELGCDFESGRLERILKVIASE